MSATGLDVFDKTLQTTNIWLGEIRRDLETDRHVAWRVLSVVLHKLRDRLPVELAAHLGSQLPILVRGVFYDQYQPARQPGDCRTLQAFVDDVAEGLGDIRPIDPEAAVRAAFAVLSRHVPGGQLENVRGALPTSLRTFWKGIETADRRSSEDGGWPAGAEI
jgi:uncharacterized protein (DUF2267 family)